MSSRRVPWLQLRNPYSTRAQRPEVVCGQRHKVVKQLEHKPARLAVLDNNVHEDSAHSHEKAGMTQRLLNECAMKRRTLDCSLLISSAAHASPAPTGARESPTVACDSDCTSTNTESTCRSTYLRDSCARAATERANANAVAPTQPPPPSLVSLSKSCLFRCARACVLQTSPPQRSEVLCLWLAHHVLALALAAATAAAAAPNKSINQACRSVLVSCCSCCVR